MTLQKGCSQLALIGALLSTAGSALAEDLAQFSQTCIDELRIDYKDGVKQPGWTIPSFDCQGDSYELPTSNMGTECDSQALLSGPGCTAGSRLGRLEVPNDDVQAVWICRKYARTDDPADDMYTDIALIISNVSVGKPESGKTCFFQNDLRSGRRFDRHVPSPQYSGDPDPTRNGDYLWGQPVQTAGYRCSECHANDAFLATPHVIWGLNWMEVTGLNRPLKGPYSVVGENFGEGSSWDYNRFIRENRINTGCAGSCHYNATGGRYAAFERNAQSLGWMGGDVRTWTHALYQMLGTNDDMSSQIIVKSDFDFAGDGVLTTAEGASWEWRDEETPSSASSGVPTGPQGDQDGYLFVETSRPHPMNAPGAIATLQTAEYDFADADLTFNYYMYGADIGDLEIQFSYQGDWYTVDTIPADDYAEWQSYSLDVSPIYNYVGPTQIRLKYVAYGGYEGDLAIDDFAIVRRNPTLVLP